MLETFKRKYNYIQEIRIRCGKNIIIHADNQDYIDETVADKGYIDTLLSYLTSNSVYAFKNEISEGYITISGGVRAGICGRAVVRNGRVEHVKEITSVNIRFAKEFIGCADPVFERINEPLKNTVFISSPGCGKTTMLRDVSRSLSYYGKNVCIIDERCEIAPFYDRTCFFDLGPRCDVMSSVSKNAGINMVLRAMNPDVIVMDEIGNECDIASVYSALNSGVKIITSFHAYDINEFKRRFEAYNVFECIVTLKKENGIGEISEILC